MQTDAADHGFSIHQAATMACLLDVIAPKPGNVHRGADFDDVGLLDFAASGVAIGPVMAAASQQSVGKTVLDAIRATRRVTGSNTNLGIVLLLAPLAKVAGGAPESGPTDPDRAGRLQRILASLDADDARLTYEAIRLAAPGGMGEVEQMDVNRPQDQATSEEPPIRLQDAMAAAADRDLVARQYVTNFDVVLNQLAPRLQDASRRWGVVEGILDTYLHCMAEHPDSLIARKCGADTATHSASLAQKVLQAGECRSDRRHKSMAELDFWLRSDGNRRNPGTTADLVTAAAFIGLVDGKLKMDTLGDFAKVASPKRSKFVDPT